jgi:LPXTG-motif cell wall-anchored protein
MDASLIVRVVAGVLAVIAVGVIVFRRKKTA